MREATTFSKNLCGLMESKGIKAHELGVAIGISRQTITQYMNDEVEPKMRAFKAIAKYFNVSCDYLLGHSIDGNLLSHAINDIGELRRNQIALMNHLGCKTK